MPEVLDVNARQGGGARQAELPGEGSSLASSQAAKHRGAGERGGVPQHLRSPGPGQGVGDGEGCTWGEGERSSNSS